ncbi:MAG TPA: hypothetical protein PKV75_12125 [Desulfobacterales bacterium]|nr:hypothetical protein [Desulfobacterales bacterium]
MRRSNGLETADSSFSMTCMQISVNFDVGNRLDQKSFNMALTHLPGMSFRTVKLDESDYPIATGLFGSIGVMMVTHHLTYFFHQL